MIEREVSIMTRAEVIAAMSEVEFPPAPINTVGEIPKILNSRAQDGRRADSSGVRP
jgi:hypothetical protein